MSLINYFLVYPKFRDHALQFSIQYGKFEVLKHLVEKYKIDVEKKLEKHYALVLTIHWKKIEILKYLIEKCHCKVDGSIVWEGETILTLACYSSRVDFIKYFVNNFGKKIDNFINITNTKGESPLFINCKQGNFEIVKYLVKMGANTKQQTLNGDSVLFGAIEGRNLEIIKFMIETCHVDPNLVNNLGEIPLHCSLGYFKSFEYLCEKSNVNLRNLNGDTALMLSCSNGLDDLVSILIDHGSDFHKPNKQGKTPFYLACERGKFNVIKLLVEKKVDLEETDTFGNSPLFASVFWGNLEIVKYMVEELKVDFKHKNLKGENALFCACTAGNFSLVKFFLQKGVDFMDEQGNFLLRISKLHGFAHIELFVKSSMMEKIKNDRV